MHVRVRSGVCGYLCLMERLIEEKPEAHSGAPIGSQESADPDTSTLNIYLSFAPILPPCLFFFLPLLLRSSLHIFHIFFSLLALPPLAMHLLEILSPSSLASLFSFPFFSLSFALSPSISFHIYPSLPPLLLSSPSLHPLSVVELQ